jgi:hypothetical protein
MNNDIAPQNPSPDSISSLILNHWKLHEPKKLQRFQQENRLQKELAAAVKRFDDQLYDLTVIQGIPYRTAWWTTIEDNLHSEPDDDELSPPPNQSESPPATSE